ncbi:MAG: type II 3-dehydroquinate dehydratase [Zoogloeaceae bacterium]|jgi:3-dehydroquinate dehydratase-2|nr:type II 3-dehydroquinate dehydratase [Zoogloeaceae bacterium]
MSNSTSNKSKSRSSAQRARILVLHGPNLNLLGKREPEIYGRATLADIHKGMEARARACGVQIESFQSNSEGELIDRIQAAASEGIEFIIINPGAYSHTSIAIPDALRGVAIPYMEVHISNIHAREAFRHHSHFSASAAGVICGLGIQGYELALDAVLARIKQA